MLKMGSSEDQMTENSMESDLKQEAVLSRASMCEEELIVD